MNLNGRNIARSLGAMPPRAAHFCLRVERFLRDQGFAAKGTSVLLAFSGGADSLALLQILYVLRDRLGFSLVLAHLDHGLRTESALEAEAAGKLAVALELPYYSTRTDVAALARDLNCGEEEAGRRARWDFFSRIRKGNGPAWIAQGHQLNDLAEDVLMRLIRGSGWPGLGGMRGLDASEKIIRPLLLTPRADIESFLSLLGLDWLRDPLNADPAYLRNRVRLEMLPLFLRENPSFLDRVADLWRLARLDEAYWTDLLDKHTHTASGQEPAQTLEREFLAELPKALRLRLYKEALESLGPGQPLVGNLLALDAAWKANRGGASVQFPGGKKALVLKGGVVFTGPRQ